MVDISPEAAAGFRALGAECSRRRRLSAAAGYARLLARGFAIVTLTATNVRQIANGHYGPAFVVGCGISAVWWFNSRNAAHSDAPGAWAAYALGAGLGTIFGMYLGGRVW